mmetsp:Transcript_20165/g.19478  ORF Transcript_20165/g.19478 Transcript_20165/m.19478 type:complete len:192 (+) Transcript_20165:130-705(+)
MVLKVTCPTVRLPSETANKKRPRGDMGWNESASSYSSSSSDGRRKNVDSGRDEINALFSSVKDYSSTSYTGLKKKEHKEDILTKLGAPSVPQQKMPFRQRIGLNEAKKKRDEKIELKAKDSGVVLAAPSKKNRNDSSRRDSSTNVSRPKVGRASSTSRSKSESDGFGINTKAGVMHLSSKRLPDKLTRPKR